MNFLFITDYTYVNFDYPEFSFQNSIHT
jgi:hypothetical protein